MASGPTAGLDAKLVLAKLNTLQQNDRIQSFNSPRLARLISDLREDPTGRKELDQRVSKDFQIPRIHCPQYPLSGSPRAIFSRLDGASGQCHRSS